MPEYSNTSASNAITIRLRLDNHPGLLAKVTSSIAENKGNIGAIDIIRVEGSSILRDITIDTAGEKHSRIISQNLDISQYGSHEKELKNPII